MRGATKGICQGRSQLSDFNSHAPCGARPAKQRHRHRRYHFNSHAPCGARRDQSGGFGHQTDFNSHAPCGARRGAAVMARPQMEFQLTRSLRGATVELRGVVRVGKISTHTPLAGRDTCQTYRRNADSISTHTPLAGRDDILIEKSNDSEISTHTPLAGRDFCYMRISVLV